MKDFKKSGDKVVWTHEEGDKYVVCGKNINGKRFRQVWNRWFDVMMHNYYSARIYIKDGNTGKKTLLKTVTP